MLQIAHEKEKQKARCFWHKKCEQSLMYEEQLEAKDIEIALLKGQLLLTASMMSCSKGTEMILRPLSITNGSLPTNHSGSGNTVVQP